MACTETYATLRIFSTEITPHRVTKALGIRPTREWARDPNAKYKHQRERHLWSLSTKESVSSTDSEDHIMKIVDLLAGKNKALHELRALGCDIDISNMWMGNGQGGPHLDVQLLGKLHELSLSVWWDNYFDGDDS